MRQDNEFTDFVINSKLLNLEVFEEFGRKTCVYSLTVEMFESLEFHPSQFQNLTCLNVFGAMRRVQLDFVLDNIHNWNSLRTLQLKNLSINILSEQSMLELDVDLFQLCDVTVTDTNFQSLIFHGSIKEIEVKRSELLVQPIIDAIEVSIRNAIKLVFDMPSHVLVEFSKLKKWEAQIQLIVSSDITCIVELYNLLNFFSF